MDLLSLKQLQSLPEDAVFGLISDSNKEYYISHTTNLKSRIGLVLTECENLLKDDTKLVILFSGTNNTEYKRIYAQYYINKYKELGYENMGLESNYINYRVKIQYSADFNDMAVYLINKRKEKTLVGMFRSKIEAEEFVKKYYEQGGPILPIYDIGVYKHIRSSKPKN